MSDVPLETCWAFNELRNNKFRYQVASCWLLLLSHTTIHGSMNIKVIYVICPPRRHDHWRRPWFIVAFFFMKQKYAVFGFYKWNIPLISPFFARHAGRSYESLYPCKDWGSGGDKTLCHITSAQFPVYSNSLRGRKEEDVTECCVSEQMDDRSLAALYNGTLTL